MVDKHGQYTEAKDKDQKIKIQREVVEYLENVITEIIRNASLTTPYKSEFTIDPEEAKERYFAKLNRWIQTFFYAHSIGVGFAPKATTMTKWFHDIVVPNFSFFREVSTYLTKDETVIHYDVRPENVLYRGSDGRIEFALCDPKKARVGPISFDLCAIINNVNIASFDLDLATRLSIFRDGLLRSNIFVPPTNLDLEDAVRREFALATFFRNIKGLGFHGSLKLKHSDRYKDYLANNPSEQNLFSYISILRELVQDNMIDEYTESLKLLTDSLESLLLLKK